MNHAWVNHIQIDKNSVAPIYQQLRDAVRNAITTGAVSPGSRLPSSRSLCAHFNVHRQTVIAATDELIAEGWLRSHSTTGLFVNDQLPLLKPVKLAAIGASYPAHTGFAFRGSGMQSDAAQRTNNMGFDDGYADVRIAPIKELGSAYIQALKEKTKHTRLSKREPVHGSLLLRTELVRLMKGYRGMGIGTEHILITQGSQMSIFLAASLLISKGDHVVVTSPNYLTSNLCFEQLGAKLLKVGVDAHGMVTEDVQRLCRTKKVKCIYVTSHHHHPTTVTLSIERRLQLLHLAQQYGFAIIEDDYDYDFHYQNRPLMPIASNDTGGHVIYLGSFSKILSHKFRIGYIIAPGNFINELITFKKVMGRQSDMILQEAIGKLLHDNVIRNHIKKATNIYKQRRDDAFELLSGLDSYMHCSKPEGGLAFWSVFDKKISLPYISAKCAARDLYFPDGHMYNTADQQKNGCRMGFASMNTKEMEIAVEILRAVLSGK